MERKEFLDKLDNESLVYDIKLRQKFANKLVTIYRDLLEPLVVYSRIWWTIILNHLMKYFRFSSISGCSAIIDCWTLGINTGGLPGKDNTIGTILVFGLAVLVGILLLFIFSKKDFSKTK